MAKTTFPTHIGSDKDSPENWYKAAALHRDMREYPLALKLLEKYLAKKIEQLGKRHDTVATIHEEIGDLCTSLYDSEKALHHTTLCLAIKRDTRHCCHPDVVNTRQKLKMIKTHRYNGISVHWLTMGGCRRGWN